MVTKVKRLAKVGEFVQITYVIGGYEYLYNIGDIFKIVEVDHNNNPYITVMDDDEEQRMYLEQEEYVVLEGYEPESAQPQCHDGDIDASLLFERIDKLEKRLDSLEAFVFNSEVTEDDTADDANVPKTRYETIEFAKSEIDRLLNEKHENVNYVDEMCANWDYNREHDDVQFIVNAKKRTVVALLRYRATNLVYARGVAKCMDEDVFNADIGKYIALMRAFNMEIPSFMSTELLQPDEIKKGNIARVLKGTQKGKLVYIHNIDKAKSMVYAYTENNNGVAGDQPYFQLLDDSETTE